ncbi:MAG TPA: response regulator transcription factor [Candidatus Sumerlaeota bacterium]|nr:response regulator transcription factor [Candidatus Sumerlaeota bacterium]
MNKKKVLIVEDDADIASTVEYNLQQEGYEVRVVEDGRNAFPTAKSFQPDIVLLDVMLPGMDGFEICKKIKSDERTADIPVVMLTVKAGEVDVVLGLELGADDYIAKPFSVRILMARIKTVLKRREEIGKETARIKYRNMIIDREKREVLVDGQDVHLSRTEFEILALLVSKPGKVFSRNTILERCWPDGVFVVDRAVDVHINAVRKKIGLLSACIQSVRGIGYRARE